METCPEILRRTELTVTPGSSEEERFDPHSEGPLRGDGK